MEQFSNSRMMVMTMMMMIVMMMVMMMMMVIQRNKTTWSSSPTRTSHSSPARRALGLGSRPLRRRPDSSLKTRKPSCFIFLKISHIKQREEYLRRCGCLFWFEAISAKISVTSSPVSIVDTSVPGHCSLVVCLTNDGNLF